MAARCPVCNGNTTQTNNTITRFIGPTDATKIYSLTFDGTFEVTGPLRMRPTLRSTE